MDLEKSINSLKSNKNKFSKKLLKNVFMNQFVNNFLTLLCKINVLHVFNIIDFFQAFNVTRRTSIVIRLDFCL